MGRSSIPLTYLPEAPPPLLNRSKRGNPSNFNLSSAEKTTRSSEVCIHLLTKFKKARLAVAESTAMSARSIMYSVNATERAHVRTST